VILVAGGTGRLGTVLVRRLSDRGLAVRVLTRERARASHLEAAGVEVAVGDVREPATLSSAVDGAEVIVSAVHGFAGPGGVSPQTVDRDGNRNLVDAAREHGADLVLMSVVGAAPDSPMELFRMKYAAEQYLLGSDVSSTIVRSTAFLELWAELMQQTGGRGGRPLVFGVGDNPINFVSVLDVAALVDRAVTDTSTRGSALEIGGPQNLTLNELAALVMASTGTRGQPRHVPSPVLRVVANTIGRVKPLVGRQVRAALAMDVTDLTFDSGPIHNKYPDLPCTAAAAAIR
jgi:NADH dehydrogenase